MKDNNAEKEKIRLDDLHEIVKQNKNETYKKIERLEEYTIGNKDHLEQIILAMKRQDENRSSQVDTIYQTIDHKCDTISTQVFMIIVAVNNLIKTFIPDSPRLPKSGVRILTDEIKYEYEVTKEERVRNRKRSEISPTALSLSFETETQNPEKDKKRVHKYMGPMVRQPSQDGNSKYEWVVRVKCESDQVDKWRQEIKDR